MGVKITDLLPIDQASITDTDVIPMVDLDSQSTKKVTIRKLREATLAVDNGDLEADVNSAERHGVLLSLNPETGGLAAEFDLDVLRSKFQATGSITYSPVTGTFSYTTPTTDGITEGTNNKYYTDARVRGAISVTGAGLGYNQQTGVISFNQGDPGAVTHVGGFIFNGFSIAVEPATITGYIVGNKLTISNLIAGTPAIGMQVTGAGVPPNMYINELFAQAPGGGIGTGSIWTLSISQNVGSSGSPVAMTLGDGDFVLDPVGNNVKVAGPLKLQDDTIQTTAFPGYAGWTHTDNVGFTSTGIGKKVSLNYGSNSVFVDTTGVSLRGGAATIKVNTSGQLVFPDNTTQTTAFNINSIANNSVLFKNNNNISSSTKFNYYNDILTVDTIHTKDINFVGTGTVDISSNSNLQISAVGTISINGAYTLPTTAGQNKRVLTTNGTNAATWELSGEEHDYTAPNNTIWSTRLYNGGTTVSYTPNTQDSTTVQNAINGSFGSEIFVNIASYPDIQQVPVGAIVNGSGLTNAEVITSIQDTIDPSLWRLVVNQSGTFTTSSSFTITWGSAGTGAVTWWDAANAPLNIANFRGAIIDYHAFCVSNGIVIGKIIISNFGSDNNVVHHESLSGSNNLSNFTFYNVANENKLQFSGGTFEEDAVVHFTSKVFYGPLTYN